ncbi:MAG: hypothetical protein NZ572_05370 [Thermoflexus sp.]|nr:hypothetical protein [Thermoflexus sp.]
MRLESGQTAMVDRFRLAIPEDRIVYKLARWGPLRPKRRARRSGNPTGAAYRKAAMRSLAEEIENLEWLACWSRSKEEIQG